MDGSRGGSELLPQSQGRAGRNCVNARALACSGPALWCRLDARGWRPGSGPRECTLQCPLSPLSSGAVRWPWPERARPGARKGPPEAPGPHQGQVVEASIQLNCGALTPTVHPRPSSLVPSPPASAPASAPRIPTGHAPRLAPPTFAASQTGRRAPCPGDSAFGPTRRPGRTLDWGYFQRGSAFEPRKI